MIGAIAGDVIGSVFEHRPTKSREFPLFREGSCFTDDTVLTIAVADAIVGGLPYGESIWRWGNRYPFAGYGGAFRGWLMSDVRTPYGSWGNGSAMRVAPVGWAFDSEEEVLRQAQLSAEVTHDHPEGIKGAESVALAVFLARTGYGKERIRALLSERFGYELDRTVEAIRPEYRFDISCQGSVPEAIIAFLDSESYEDAVRLAVSLGGDADTQACIAGGIAEAFYGEVPAAIRSVVRSRLPEELTGVIESFGARFGVEF
ncbi:MAG: ADP-ribosylglycohydrolase family protein [Fimbriimonadaceae bacterium]|nr:ADP-ribosylglycohydrolase family protein [Fimbriimonadaceae bacterium]